jgi:hypothetical protein
MQSTVCTITHHVQTQKHLPHHIHTEKWWCFKGFSLQKKEKWKGALHLKPASETGYWNWSQLDVFVPNLSKKNLPGCLWVRRTTLSALAFLVSRQIIWHVVAVAGEILHLVGAEVFWGPPSPLKKIFSRVCVTIDGVLDNWIYWPLTGRNYK